MEIVLGWDCLKHDIEQWTWRLGDTRKEDPGERFQSQSDDRAEDGTFIRRKTEEAVAALRLVLSDRLETGGTGKVSDDTLDTGTASWVIRLREGGRLSGADGLADLAHKYVVWYALWNWSLIYFTDMSAKLEEELKVIAGELEDSAYRLVAPRKYKRKPARDIDEVTVDEVEIDTEDMV